MTVPCYHCPARRAAAVNDAGAARGDKIRRDMRRHGLSGRKNR